MYNIRAALGVSAPSISQNQKEIIIVKKIPRNFVKALTLWLVMEIYTNINPCHQADIRLFSK